jgi:acetyl esterase/lipase
MSSLRAKLVRAVTGALMGTIDAEKANVQRVRSAWHTLSKRLRAASGVEVQQDILAGMHCEWLTPAEPLPGKVLLYIHGGAYLMGDCTTHRKLVSHMARACGVQAVMIEYRLAPENQFPAAVDDVVAAYTALLEKGFSGSDILVAGDSAGGGLTMALLLSLRDSGSILPSGALLLSPWLDLTSSGESARTRADQDPWFKAEDISHVAAYYCNDDELQLPLVSPVFADVAGLPPVFIQVGDDEILLSDSTRIAEKLEQGGGEVTLEVWPQMWHVFQMFVGLMPESREAIDKFVPFVRERLAAGSEA